MRRSIISVQRDSMVLATRFAWLQNDVRQLQDQISEITTAESPGSTGESAELAAEVQLVQVAAGSEPMAEDSIDDSTYVMVEEAQVDVDEDI